jgi:hypothetical protein
MLLKLGALQRQRDLSSDVLSCFFFTSERPMQMRQLGRLPVKSERRSLGMGATQREGVRGGSVTPSTDHLCNLPASQ